MAGVKNDTVARGDGPVVESFFADQLEKLIGARACFQQTGMEIVTDADSGCRECSHDVDPFF